MRSVRVVNSLLFILLIGLLILPACKRQPPPAARTPLPVPLPDRPVDSDLAPAPSVEITASPSTIAPREQTTLNWRSNNASSIVIDSGIGNVENSGSVVVSPRESTTYTAIATGPGGNARSSTRVTIVPRNDVIQSTDIENLARAIAEGRVKPIFFDYDQAQLSTQARSTLEVNARLFREFSGASVIIEGHCDERGTEEYNLALGDRRAQATRGYLIQLGIEENRLKAISFGEERPFSPEHTEAAYRLNRRAHFVVEQ